MSVEKSNNNVCFFCTRVINGNAVVWDEAVSNTQDPDDAIRIHLHPSCATMLGERLIGDGVKAQDKLTDKDMKRIMFLVGSRIKGCF